MAEVQKHISAYNNMNPTTMYLLLYIQIQGVELRFENIPLFKALN